MSTTIETFAECTHTDGVVLKPPRRTRVTGSLRRKRAYVCHPFADVGGDGLASLCDIARTIIERGDVPIAPQLFFLGIVDERADPDLALSLHLEFVALSDEVHVYGPTITPRMKKELDCALELGIAIRFMEVGS